MSRFTWIRKVWTVFVARWRRRKLWILHVFALVQARARWIRIGWTEFVGHWRRGKRWGLRVLPLAWETLRRFAWLFIAAAVLVIVWLTFKYWDWLGAVPNGQDRQETNSSTLRNVGLLFAGFVALLIAVWRSWVAGRQAKTAEQDLLNDRYQKGTEMLGNDVLSVRLGGIYALQRLAEEHPEQYHIQIMRLFCAFVRHPTKDKSAVSMPDQSGETSHKLPSLRADVQTVMQAIADRKTANIALEREANFALDFRDADLQGMICWSGDLSGAVFIGADLSGANFVGTNLSNVYLIDVKSPGCVGNVNLSSAHLMRIENFSKMTIGGYLNVSDAYISELDLSGARLMGVRNLTQSQLDQAHADPDNPPRLGGLVDPETGERLVWHNWLREGWE